MLLIQNSKIQNSIQFQVTLFVQLKRLKVSLLSVLFLQITYVYHHKELPASR